MSATLSVSPTPLKMFIGASYQLRLQVRDSDVRRPYDCTGASGSTLNLVSLTGGTIRGVAAAVVWEAIASGICTVLVANADTTALSPGRWYLELRLPTVTAEGGGTLIPDLFPFDVVAQ
jgi:hypothetical protein